MQGKTVLWIIFINFTGTNNELVNNNDNGNNFD